MRKYNITMIVLDTLRLDMFNKIKDVHDLSSIGNFSEIENCIAPSSWTLPSHASLFTGMYPSKHGSHETKTLKSLDIANIKLKRRTMVSELKELGYNTYAISANPYVHPIYGFDEFDFFKEESYFTDIFGSVFEISQKLKPRLAKYREAYGTDVFKIFPAILRDDPGLFFEAAISGLAPTISAATKKLRAKTLEGWPVEKGGKRTVKNVRILGLKEPFFLFINLMEPHDPYVGLHGKDFNWATPFLKNPPPEELMTLWKKLYYKASVMGYDYAFQILKNIADRFGEEQIMALTSDHGQCFGEHKFIGHGTMLYDELVKVPFAVSMPKRFGEAHQNGFSSLVNFRKFLLAALEEDKNAASRLYSKSVRSESFGIPSNVSMVAGIDKKKIAAAEKVVVRKFK